MHMGHLFLKEEAKLYLPLQTRYPPIFIMNWTGRIRTIGRHLIFLQNTDRPGYYGCEKMFTLLAERPVLLKGYFQ